MASPKHDRIGASAGTRRLIKRYLSPSGNWDAHSDAALRKRLAQSDTDRAVYRREIVAHRLMVGGDPGQPSGTEDRRRMDALLDQFAVPDAQSVHEGPAQSSHLSWGRWLTGFFAGCAAIVMAVFTNAGPEPHKPWQGMADYQLTARGDSQSHTSLVGFGVTGVTEKGIEYEVISSGRVFHSDYMRFSYTNKRASEVGHLFLFGLQKTASGSLAVRWYAPEPNYGESRSVAAPQATAKAFDFETRLSTDHAVGPLRFVAIFSDEPIELATVQRATDSLSISDALNPPHDSLETWLRVRLGLMPKARIQIEDTQVVAGSHSANSGDIR